MNVSLKNRHSTASLNSSGSSRQSSSENIVLSKTPDLSPPTTGSAARKAGGGPAKGGRPKSAAAGAGTRKSAFQDGAKAKGAVRVDNVRVKVEQEGRAARNLIAYRWWHD
jgi:hypothetical protein